MNPAHNRSNFTGRRFGKLVALKPDGKYRGKIKWLCQCDCGKQKIVIGCNLTSGGSASCGCVTLQSIAKRAKMSVKGQLDHLPTYETWTEIKKRCSDARHSNYAGRGVRVCSFIASSPLNLAFLIGKKPDMKKPREISIDRKNNDGHYSCGQCCECLENGWEMNVRWVNQKQQMRNASYNRMITIGGVTRCMAEWAEVSGINYSCFQARCDRGEYGETLLRPVL